MLSHAFVQTFRDSVRKEKTPTTRIKKERNKKHFWDSRGRRRTNSTNVSSMSDFYFSFHRQNGTISNKEPDVMLQHYCFKLDLCTQRISAFQDESSSSNISV
jgi:hypothetical protein